MEARPQEDESDGTNAVLAERVDVTEELALLRIAPDAGSAPEFEPGQFVQLGLVVDAPVRRPPGGGEGDTATATRRRLVRRAYSIASSALERSHVELCVVRVPGGRLTDQLWSLGAGHRVWLEPEARGEFTLGLAPPDADLVLVATGTGIAPFMSMLRTYRGAGRWRRAVLVHGVRRARDLVYREELEELGLEDPTFAYAPVVSREPQESPWRGLRGRVQAVLWDGTWQTVSDVPLAPESTHVFLCGNPDMIRDVGERLAARGFRPDHAGAPGNLHYERYW